MNSSLDGIKKFLARKFGREWIKYNDEQVRKERLSQIRRVCNEMYDLLYRMDLTGHLKLNKKQSKSLAVYIDQLKEHYQKLHDFVYLREE